MGVQRDTQDFNGFIQRSHSVTNSHLRMESGLLGAVSEQCHDGFLESNGELLPSAHLTKEEHSWLGEEHREHGQGGGVPRFEALVRGACA